MPGVAGWLASASGVEHSVSCDLALLIFFDLYHRSNVHDTLPVGSELFDRRLAVLLPDLAEEHNGARFDQMAVVGSVNDLAAVAGANVNLF